MNQRDDRRPGRMRLERQLWLALLVPIAVVVALYGVVAHVLRQRVLMSEASAELRNYATLVEAALSTTVARGQVDLLKQRIERLARAERILGIAAFEDGAAPVLSADLVDVAEPELRAIAARAQASRGAELEEQHDLDGRPVLVRTVTLAPGPSARPVVAIVVRDLRYVDALADTLDRGLVATGAALLVLTAVLAAIASRLTVGRPAGTLVAGVERVAAGDLATTVPAGGAEELARLARAFNRMTASLAEARARAEREEAARASEQAARAAVERKLQHAQALAAVGQVAASIGHEIGSPLNVVLGRAQRAAARADCPEPIRRELETIATQSERISRVVARLLNAARPPRISTRGSDVALVAQEALAFLAPECRQRRIRAHIDGAGPAHAALDADRLFQIIFNLCLNAMQAQPDTGEIMVRIAPRPASGDEAERIAFEVEVRGPGVPPELAPHIFEAFFTSKGDRGTGLGLAIVSGLVREAGGTIELVPTEHGGACFRVELPRERAAVGMGRSEVRA